MIIYYKYVYILYFRKVCCVMQFNVGDIVYLKSSSDSNESHLQGYKKVLTDKGETYFKPQDAIAHSSRTGFHKIKSTKITKPSTYGDLEELELEVEYVASENWINKMRPDWFFVKLIKMGFSVISRDIACVRLDENCDPIKKYERSWFAISPERGVYITMTEYDQKMNNPWFHFMLLPADKGHVVDNYFASYIYKALPYEIYNLPSPFIFEFLENLKMINVDQDYSKGSFHSPYMRSWIYAKANGTDGFEKADEKAMNEYNRLNRKFFLNLSEKNKEFLWKYTDIGTFFKKNSKR